MRDLILDYFVTNQLKILFIYIRKYNINGIFLFMLILSKLQLNNLKNGRIKIIHQHSYIIGIQIFAIYL